jgi:hypothetical protein
MACAEALVCESIGYLSEDSTLYPGCCMRKEKLCSDRNVYASNSLPHVTVAACAQARLNSAQV